jgi:hypothetical protein
VKIPAGVLLQMLGQAMVEAGCRSVSLKKTREGGIEYHSRMSGGPAQGHDVRDFYRAEVDVEPWLALIEQAKATQAEEAAPIVGGVDLR